MKTIAPSECCTQMLIICSMLKMHSMQGTDSTYSALIDHSIHSMCSTAQHAQHVQYNKTPVGQTTIWPCPLVVIALSCLPCRYQQLYYK